MKDIKKAIKGVQDHFIKKLLNGEFELLKADQYTASILIEGYEFVIWLGNMPKNRKFEKAFTNNFMHVPMTDEQAIAAYEVTEPRINEYRQTIGREAVVNKIEALKKELESLEVKEN